ncbi:hypothetical protein TrVE_jg11933 [Triparma verrucosa]|uniref:Transketolase-like pyrimidine-binding domain-containing protein n=1 Tax=Triparma verrucosa TaxID=1606542 RepID=A0A9W7C3K6_9STRA|nr:hypothetical protein TrVE_jg11933 [Triparma verrucosa]
MLRHSQFRTLHHQIQINGRSRTQHAPRRTLATLLSEKRTTASSDIEALSESVALNEFRAYLDASKSRSAPIQSSPFELPAATTVPLLQSIFTTFWLHYHSRVASLCGEGFYTIGPCGEENLSGAALALEEDDSVALHYRHLGISVLRGWRRRSDGKYDQKSFEKVVLDRARGYTVSLSDPVTAGNHCALGGNPTDFIVTSTLASQAPPAVGRALGNTLAHHVIKSSDHLTFPKKAVHYVTLGDGSINNAHFLAALNLARYAQHNRQKCPVVFGISNNEMCISLKGNKYLSNFLQSAGVQVFECDGNRIGEVYQSTRDAVEYSRKKGRPSIVVYKDLKRRFGHAATDRQNAYLEDEVIEEQRAGGNLERACEDAVASGEISWDEVARIFEEVGATVEHAFDEASQEPKVSERKQQLEQASQPRVEIPRLLQDAGYEGKVAEGRKDIMRKNMNKGLAEQLETNPRVVYLGEDVEHGGYYLVTDSLAKKFPRRVRDFPPDETTLIGAGMGYAQAGLVPIVEIPYAKYLDCGADMFFEACVSNWLSGGKAGLGMVFRLQGFDRGTFGGNFHTHNTLHMPPGIDVVCYSNGEDYIRGLRGAVKQAEGGRLTMLVDCTDLLNKRHLVGKDKGWLRAYPADSGEALSVHDVRVYGTNPSGRGKIAVVSYGNGVVTSLQAREELSAELKEDVDVIDCMLLSEAPDGLKEELQMYDKVVFADICKEGQNPFSGMLPTLNRTVDKGGAELSKKQWSLIAACKTYNPLGNLVTFLNVEDVKAAINEINER